MDIVEQLRKSANIVYAQDGYTFRLGLQNEAADEIERLRQQNAELLKVLKEIANADMFDDECKPTGGGYLINKARAAIAKATRGE